MPYLLVAHSFCNPLPSGFRAKISSQVKTMEQLKRGIKVGDKTAFDLESINLLSSAYGWTKATVAAGTHIPT